MVSLYSPELIPESGFLFRLVIKLVKESILEVLSEVWKLVQQLQLIFNPHQDHFLSIFSFSSPWYKEICIPRVFLLIDSFQLQALAILGNIHEKLFLSRALILHDHLLIQLTQFRVLLEQFKLFLEFFGHFIFDSVLLRLFAQAVRQH